jgi:hypothetical protein
MNYIIEIEPNSIINHSRKTEHSDISTELEVNHQKIDLFSMTNFLDFELSKPDLKRYYLDGLE